MCVGGGIRTGVYYAMTGVTNDNKLYLFAGVPPVGALHAALTINVKIEEIVRAAPIVRQVVVAFNRLAVVEPGLQTAQKPVRERTKT